MRVVVTGAGGNLGQKLLTHLSVAPWCSEVIALDVTPVSATSKVRWLSGDLGDPRDDTWWGPVSEADAIVHFAARNPTARQSWIEALASFDMTQNLLSRTGVTRPTRVVFASSNHVMGGYKDQELPLGGSLSDKAPPLPGTRYYEQGSYRWGVAYGGGKLFGERACFARALASEGRVSAVVVRIGWCQPGENLPGTISTAGLNGGQEPVEDERRSLRWFRNMWLSNRDFLHLMERSIRADSASWPLPAVIVSGVSANSGTQWDLGEAATLIDYHPVDNIWDHVIQRDT